MRAMTGSNTSNHSDHHALPISGFCLKRWVKLSPPGSWFISGLVHAGIWYRCGVADVSTDSFPAPAKRSNDPARVFRWICASSAM